MRSVSKVLLGLAATLTLGVVSLPADAASCNLPQNFSVQRGENVQRLGSISGLPSGSNRFSYYLSYGSNQAPISNINIYAFPGIQNPNIINGPGGANINLAFKVSSTAPIGSTRTITVYVQPYPSGPTLCSDTVKITVAAAHCTPDAWWINPNPASWQDRSLINAWYDGANCYVHAIPAADGAAFVWNNNFYQYLGKNFYCEAGWFNGAHCYLGTAPAGTTAFKYGNAFYYAE